MRYGISGSNAMWAGEASSGADNATVGLVALLHGTATSTLLSRRKVFFLRGLWAHPIASGLIIALADASISATEVRYNTKFVMTVASWVEGAASQIPVGSPFGIAKIDFPAPGIKFTTNCCVYLVSGSGATYGMFGGNGYEE